MSATKSASWIPFGQHCKPASEAKALGAINDAESAGAVQCSGRRAKLTGPIQRLLRLCLRRKARGPSTITRLEADAVVVVAVVALSNEFEKWYRLWHIIHYYSSITSINGEWVLDKIIVYKYKGDEGS